MSKNRCTGFTLLSHLFAVAMCFCLMLADRGLLYRSLVLSVVRILVWHSPYLSNTRVDCVFRYRDFCFRAEESRIAGTARRINALRNSASNIDASCPVNASPGRCLATLYLSTSGASCAGFAAQGCTMTTAGYNSTIRNGKRAERCSEYTFAIVRVPRLQGDSENGRLCQKLVGSHEILHACFGVSCTIKKQRFAALRRLAISFSSAG